MIEHDARRPVTGKQILAVTGASGFLGRHLLAACAARGLGTRALTRRTSTKPGSGDHLAYEGDLLNAASLPPFLGNATTLLHLAYLQSGYHANLEAARNLVTAVRCSNVKRVIYCSTAAVIGRQARGVVTEETTPQPAGEYQQAKYAVEQELRTQLSGVEFAILRPTEIVGPGGEGLLTLISRVRTSSRIVNAAYRAGFKARRFNYVSVRNVVAALIVLAVSPVEQHGDIYQIDDDDDPDNNYLAVEAIVTERLGIARRKPRLGLPHQLLSLLLRLKSGAAPPDRVHSHAKITALGYCKVTTLRQEILDLLSSLEHQSPQRLEH